MINSTTNKIKTGTKKIHATGKRKMWKNKRNHISGNLKTELFITANHVTLIDS